MFRTFSVLALAAVASVANAGVMSSGIGISVESSPIGFLGNNTNRSDTLVRLYTELTGVTAPGGLPAGDLSVGPATGRVDSFLFHYDPAGSGIGTIGGTGYSATFDGEILAVFTTAQDLNATDSVFGAPGTVHSTRIERRLENVVNPGGTPDIISLVGSNGVSIQVLAANFTGYDQFRVLVRSAPVVNSVPEPASFAIFGFALVCAGGVRARRRFRRGEVSAA